MLKWVEYEEKRYSLDEVRAGALIEYFPMNYMMLVIDERPWRGKPSVTQCINGTRLEYLKLLIDFGVNPDDSAFRVIGTRGHALLEPFAPVRDLAELPLDGDELTGRLDILEHVGQDRYWLTDTKTWGSYPVMRALGLVKKKRPAVDENGQPVLYQKSGKWGKAGTQKTEDYYEIDPAAVDMKDAELQLNGYRVLLKDYFGVTAEKVRIFAIVRDGNTVSSRGRGLFKNTYMIWAKELPDDKVRSYFFAKARVLTEYMEAVLEEADHELSWEANVAKHIPPPCSKEEAWDGNRCRGYCPVAEFCARVGNPYISPSDIAPAAVSEDNQEGADAEA